MKRFTILLLAILSVMSCAKDIVDLTGDIKGIVKDYGNGQLISNCQVSMSPGGQSFTTSDNGQFEFGKLEPGDYTLSFSKAGYEDASYNVSVVAGQVQNVQITLKAFSANISVSEDELTFGSASTTMSFTIVNSGKGNLEWSISENAEWLSCSPVSGNVMPSQSATVVVSVNRNNLEKGNYSENLVVSSNVGNATIAVSMSVTPIDLTLTPSSLDFGASESSIGISMTNHSGKTLKYNITTSNNWLSVSKASGSITTSDSFTAIVSRSGLSVGDYDGNIIINVEGESLSIPVQMKVAPKESPSVSIEEVNTITAHEVTVKAILKSIGSTKVTRYGVCWSTSPNPTIDNKFTNLGDCSEAKAYESTISELNAETKYYVRAYAENAEGLAYSSQTLSFTTSAEPTVPKVSTISVNDITTTSATAIGKITSLGNVVKIIEHGHVWGTSPHPTISGCAHSSLGESTSAKEFSSDVISLSAGTKYYIRAYATNSEGTAYGDDVTFVTRDYEVPTVSIGQASNIQNKSFSIIGEIKSTGGLDLIDYGHCWSTSHNPTTSDSKTSLGIKSTEGTYNSEVSGLAEGTTYYVRAYATNSKGTNYSSEITVTTTESGTDKWDGNIATSFAGGSGTNVDPYIIKTGGQLLLMKNYNNKSFKLDNNIDLNNHNWLPFEFNGSFDGNGYTIKNLYVNRTTNNQGLFSIIENATLKNITISGVRINAGAYNNIGSLVGDFQFGEIINCNIILHADSKLLGKSNVGGLVGSMGNGYADSKMISNCSVDNNGIKNILGETNVGGVLGFMGGGYNGQIEKCSFTGGIKGSSKVGGIVGYEQYGKLSLYDCFVSGSIEGDSYVGGIFGACDHNGYGCTYIYSSKASVSITVTNGYAGGIFGGDTRFMNIIACYSDGIISSNSTNCNNICGIGVGADCELCYSTISSSLRNYKQLGYMNDSKDCTGTVASDDIASTLRDYYSSYANYYNFSNTWTWTGEVNGTTKSISCPKLSWE